MSISMLVKHVRVLTTNLSTLKSSVQYRNLGVMKQVIIDQLKSCSELRQVRCVYASMVKTNDNQDCFLVNQFISACSKFGCSDSAALAFAEMEDPNVFVYNALIRGFTHCSQPEEAVKYYLYLLRREIAPTSYTFSSVIKGCTMLRTFRLGEAVHGHVWKNGFGEHVFVQTTLIDFYSILDGIAGSRKVFDCMPERDVFAWTTMLTAYVRNGDMDSARRLFEGMPEKNTATWNTVIDGYSRLGNVESAEWLFKNLPSKDIISWTTMINCYSQSQRYSEALDIFSDMTAKGIIPDAVTMASVISACAHLGALDIGKKLHLYVMANRFDLDVYIGSALIDMYAKCGSMERSLLVFVKLRNKNLFCWNSIIEGLAVHGYGDEALRMFDKMERDKIEPNSVTFISVLNACTHAGLVEQGRQRFHSMIHDYSISPQVEHYGCMVDLLGKAGLIEDALEVIKSMECEPNSIIWGALLGGCKLHKNLDVAQIAAKKLMVLEPHNSGYYNLLVNMYAEGNRWGEVAKIRNTMKDFGVEKTCPGSSWIEMGSTVHRFAASDKSHPYSGEIHLLLDEIYEQMKLVDYALEAGNIISEAFSPSGENESGRKTTSTERLVLCN